MNPSTVSRALARPGRVAAATEERIRQVAQELGYSPNPLARALQTGKTHMVALVIADFGNPVFVEAIRGASALATAEDYTLIVADSAESPERETETTRRLIPTTDGIVLIGSRARDEDIRDLATRTRVALINRKVSGVASWVTDPTLGVASALDRLRELGHEAVLFVAGPANSWMSKRRWTVLSREAGRRGMTAARIDGTTPTVEGGHHVAEQVLESDATAVVAYNDMIAIGILEGATERGARVPESFSLIGFDNVFGTAHITPGLSTIESPLDEAARLAFGSVIHDEAPASATPLESRFIARDSIGPARGR